MSFKEYLKTQSSESASILTEMHDYVLGLIPGATFCINYGMPSFKTTEVVVWFAAFKNHLGFYPTGAGVSAFEDQLQKYKYSKGAIQFPLDKPFPKKLVKDIVLFRLKAIAAKEAAKINKKKK
jgi:uncharacterized protein YdhG (YjbR/CyaY superfamily)